MSDYDQLADDYNYEHGRRKELEAENAKLKAEVRDKTSGWMEECKEVGELKAQANELYKQNQGLEDAVFDLGLENKEIKKAHALTTQRLGEENRKNNELEEETTELLGTAIELREENKELQAKNAKLKEEVERLKNGTVICPHCGGRGDIDTETATCVETYECDYCDGRGELSAVKELQAELDKANNWEALYRLLKDTNNGLNRQLDTANKRAEEYKYSIKRFVDEYGRHKKDCMWHVFYKPCDCGYEEALRSLSEDKKLVTCPECEEGSDGNCYCGYQNVEPTRVEYEKFAQSVLDDHYCEPTDEQERCGVCKALRALREGRMMDDLDCTDCNAYSRHECCSCQGTGKVLIRPMTTTEKSEYLFNKLKREGECWHDSFYPHFDGCSKCCNLVLDESNPDFFSPPSDKEWEYFGRMWERAKENVMLIRTLERFLERRKISCAELANALYYWFKETEERGGYESFG